MSDKIEGHTLHCYDEELQTLRGRVIEMGDLVLRQLCQSLESLRKADRALAEQVIQRERDINELEVATDNEIFKVLARRCPVAGDLRFVMAASRIINNLERIGDEAAKLGNFVLGLHTHNGHGPGECPFDDVYAVGELAIMHSPSFGETRRAHLGRVIVIGMAIDTLREKSSGGKGGPSPAVKARNSAGPKSRLRLWKVVLKYVSLMTGCGGRFAGVRFDGEMTVGPRPFLGPSGDGLQETDGSRPRSFGRSVRAMNFEPALLQAVQELHPRQASSLVHPAHPLILAVLEHHALGGGVNVDDVEVGEGRMVVSAVLIHRTTPGILENLKSESLGGFARRSKESW